MLDVRQELKRYNGEFIGGEHLFISTAGPYLTGYVNCEVLFPHFGVMWDLVSQLIEPFLGDIEVFVGPSTGDIVHLQYATIIANQRGHLTKMVWADKQSDNSYVVTRNGFPEQVPGKRVAVLNDRISQGGTTVKVINEVRRLGGEVVGVGTFAGVTRVTAETLEVPMLHALSTIDVQAFPQGELPVEYQGWPVVIDEPLGHGHEWKEHHPDHPGGFVKLL